MRKLLPQVGFGSICHKTRYYSAKVVPFFVAAFDLNVFG
jgi:hypothetical protein